MKHLAVISLIGLLVIAIWKSHEDPAPNIPVTTNTVVVEPPKPPTFKPWSIVCNSAGQFAVADWEGAVNGVWVWSDEHSTKRFRDWMVSKYPTRAAWEASLEHERKNDQIKSETIRKSQWKECE